MRIRTAAAVAAVLAFTVVGCSSGNSSDSKPDTIDVTSPESSKSADSGDAAEGAGLPDEPTGDKRSAVLAAILDVNGNLIRDEDKAIDAARNQCAALDGGAADPNHSAAQRFSYDGVTLTDDDGSHINIGLRKTLCPEA
ncbi:MULTISPECIES: hypothetical protein [unclassified Streptomyces]|uniref:hypothetical protein n=1 Tax=unclassified Streptomyces TaxID=2593676 RepID=UPI00093974C7|nr:hypothetical protein [Streptomyces sp. CB02058]OKI96089.1 hypothetical protein AMK10_10635 [Streptomyces sp. CB02058]